jgi:hypothetical protein
MDLCGTAILPLQLAAKEAWMSINAVLVTAARLRFLLNLKGIRLGGGP